MEDRVPSRRVKAAMAAAVVGLVAAAAMLWLMHERLLPLGVPGEWTWQQRTLPLLPGPAALVAAVIALGGAIAALDAARKEKIRRAQAAIALVVLAITSYALPLAMLMSEPAGYARATLSVLSDLSMGYLSEATKIGGQGGLEPWLHDTARRTNLGIVPARVATHPPGPVLFYDGLRALTARHPGLQRVVVAPLLVGRTKPDDVLAAAKQVSSGKLRFSDISAACLSIWLLGLAVPVVMLGTFALARWWLGPREAVVAAVIVAAVPSLWVFTPGIDVVGAAWVVGTLALAFGSMVKRRLGWAVGAGIVWGIGLQWSFGLSAIVIVLAVVWLLKGRPLGWKLWACVAGGVIVAHLPLVLLGYNPVANFFGSMAAQHKIMSVRHYLPWVFMDGWDILLFSGPALVALAAAAAGRTKGLGAGLVTMIVLLLLSGATRGEVGRIYCFLAPPLAVCAAAALTSATESPFLLSGTIAVAAQLVAALGLGTYLLLVTP